MTDMMVSKVIEITSPTEYNDFVDSNRRAVIFYGAEDCPSCVQLKDMYRRIANRYHKRVALAYTDVNKCQLALRFIPTFVSYYKSNETNRITGADIPRLKSFIKDAIIQK